MTGATTVNPSDSHDREQFYRAVGKKMKAVRYKKGFTQEAIAASVGLSRTSLTNIEKGRQKLLLHTFVGIASALGVGIAELLPDPAPIPDEIHDRINPRTTLEERVFIARTIVPVVPDEPPNPTKNKQQRQPIAPRKPRSKSSS